ncbi:hypothetical protein ACVWXO_008681 [Bradyrhizobium sp. LM2.7]
MGEQQGIDTADRNPQLKQSDGGAAPGVDENSPIAGLGSA